MRIKLLKKEKIINFILPNNVLGNYWISDVEDNKTRNLVNIEAVNGSWLLKSNYEVKVSVGGNFVDSTILQQYNFYILKIGESENIILYVEPTIDFNSSVKLKVNNDAEYLIGSSNECDIIFQYNALKDKHLMLKYQNGQYYIKDLVNSQLLYVNDIAKTESNLKYGDVIFLCGLKIIVMKDYLLLNQIGNSITCSSRFEKMGMNYSDIEIDEYDEDNNVKPLYNKEDYFYKSPRFKTIIESENMSIDAPPPKQEEKDMPILYTVGPMITMSMTSVVFALSAINNMTQNNRSVWTVLPTIVMAVAMLSSCALWPSLTRKWEKRQRAKRELERQDKYSNYIEGKRDKIKLMMKMQTQILKDNYIPLEECANIILSRKTNLWNREISDNDFLSLRVGVGILPLDIDIKYKEEDFMMEDDDLKVLAESLVRETRNLENVPISYSLKDKFISGIVGRSSLIKSFLDGLILQITTFYAYDQVKIVFMTNENSSYKWDYLKILPHLFSNDRQVRFFCSSMNEKKEISLYLERIFQNRLVSDNSKKEEAYKNYNPYYVIISDDYNSIRDLEIIKDVLNQEVNIGFSLLILNNKLSELPNECENFINIDEKSSGIFESEVTSDKQQEFAADFIKNIDIVECFKRLANIPIELLEEDTNLPKTLGFLEMYNVGMVEQLNILNRYRRNTSISSLAAPVGVDKIGELLYLDLHEKAHGPHGLIAGMTGSGKSEFIITYILSMAINYSPDEVAFVLIDYKGGGLAGAFLNKETGVKLPHLAGTITNLDIADMNRSLVSIQSELRRRQEAFNIARDEFNESTIDIYKYQTLYKEGKVKEPIPHLIIISDEFAELKAQQPDFMDQLISTARIGRSLGVHLILATQKPTGVVNEQIWSNSKFRVCLKVQEKNDSVEMIKTPDAAQIQNVGRFYLQVGYNELFTLGQSAWCGTKYYPAEKIKKKVDTSIEFIDNIANVIKSVDKEKETLQADGEELTSILKHIISVCNGNEAKRLWLDKISEIIFVDDIKEKYHHEEAEFYINPIIGEYDNPSNQKQGLLSLPLYDCSNTVIYGIAGSGKELFLTTMLYSIITNHSPEEINIYILDCGTEALKIFNNAPQVGDILSINDEEKIDKLLQFLEKEINNRKEIFADYAGDYSVYIKNSLSKLPMVLLILNNYDNFIEAYDNYFERLSQLIREGSKYGITTIMTTTSPNSMRYRLRQNFKQEFTLQLANENEYSNIFGRFDKIPLSSYKGRGLVKIDSVFEYQVAYPYEESSLSKNIRDLCITMSQKYNLKAKKVPILPRIVDINYMKPYVTNLKKMPIGVNKNTLEVETYDFTLKGVTLIAAQDINVMAPFLTGFLQVSNNLQNTEVIMLDAEEIIESNEVFHSNFNQIIDKMYDIIAKNTLNISCLCVIIGVDSLISKIDAMTKNKLIELLAIDRDLNNLSFVFADSYTKLKKLEYEPWYKGNVNGNSGIWIGNGIINQYTIVLNKISREHREEIPDNFGYIIRSGKTSFVKLLEPSTNDTEVNNE